ncbi:hypothetical protein B5F77_06390 [Parabacteroides sp. An277]|uniref:tetratricopeptide repeat protein n=1 Tax=Parabacteroides sp. An277 TaxID=1965619 RepID=UPI000B38F7DA|nr:hypothetical protein [Parabacteroides sp. An277]OUO53162.1 hypothetical protein B5F77_06390 [Parabacteroides sp. An277]
MKRIVLLVAFCLGIGQAFAQDVDALRDAGDAALQAKNYPEALAKYSEYLKLNEYKDTVRIYNCAISATQAKNYEEAAKYFDMAVNYGYNLDDSYVGEAQAYSKLKKTDEFLATTEAGLKALPGDKDLEKLLYNYCIKEGQAAKKKGDVATATKMFKSVLLASNKTYQEGALYSLGAMIYNQGATGLQKADITDAERTQCYDQLKEAKGYLDQAVAINGKLKANAQKLVDAITASLPK